MNEISYQIEVKQFTDISEVSKIKIELSDLELFKSATFNVGLYKTDDSYYKNIRFTLTGDDYNNWGNSDEYVINKICEDNGFVIVPS